MLTPLLLGNSLENVRGEKFLSEISLFHDEIGANASFNCMFTAMKSNNVSCSIEIEFS